MKRIPRRKAIAITCLAGALAVVCFVFLWPEVRAWWVKRGDAKVWNKWRENNLHELLYALKTFPICHDCVTSTISRGRFY